MHLKQRIGKRRSTAILFAAAMGAIALASSRRAWAGTDSWIGVTDGNWTDGTRWTTATQPGNTDDAYLTTSFSGSQTITFDYSGPATTYNSVTVGATGGGNNLLLMSANTLNTLNVTVADTSGSTGSYRLAGGSLIAQGEMFGNAGYANMNQSGGVNTVTNPGSNADIFIANGVGSSAAYTLSAGTIHLSVAAQFGDTSEYVGNYGSGAFNQSGGTNSFGGYLGSLYLGYQSGSTGAYTLSSGSLIGSTSEFAGYGGSGTFIQSGGTNSTGGLNVGFNFGSTGTYTLQAGSLTTQSESINGNFNQSGGTNAMTGNGLFISTSGVTTGAYTLSAGSLSGAINEYVGGIFNQSGGTHTLKGPNSSLYVGYGSTGSYTLSAGSLGNVNVENIGYASVGTFNQSGGTNTVIGVGQSNALSGGVALGPVAGGSGTYAGTYNLTGGTLSAPNVYVGGSASGAGGQGILNVSRTGQMTVSGNLVLYNTAGSAVNLNGGSMSVGGLSFPNPALFNWSTGTLAINSSVHFDSFAQGNSTTNAFGAALNLNNAQTLTIVGNETFGGAAGFTMTVNPGGANNVSGALVMGPIGEMDLSGGSVSAASLLIQQYGTFNWTTGSLTLTSSAFEVDTAGVFGPAFTLNDFQTLTTFQNQFIGATSAGSLIQNGGTNSINGAASGLYLGNSNNVTGAYTLSAGTLAVKSEYIGAVGVGNFTQSGGTNAFVAGGALYLGVSNHASGSYALSGGSISGTVSQYVGFAGAGNFNQSGGTNTLTGAAGTLYVGLSNTAAGAYALSGGSLSAATQYIGYSTRGSFNQSGGSNALAGGKLYLGYNTGSSGAYTLSAGSLTNANSEYIGYSGSGSFNQSGGFNTLTGPSPFAFLRLGYNVGSTGTYTLSGGTLSGVNNLSVGVNGNGNFNQTGGAVVLAGSPGFLILGAGSGTTGNYTLSGGSINGANDQRIGAGGSGNFNQSGGTNTLIGVSSALSVGYGGSSSGTYNLSGGTLAVAGGTYIGGSANGPAGAGRFTISSAGQFSTGNLSVWDQGAAVLAGGSSTASTTYNVGTIAQTGGVANLGALSGAGALAVGNPSGNSAAMTLSAMGQSTVLIDSTGSLVLSGGSSNNTINSLQINPGGLLDLTSTALTISYGTKASPNATVRNYISNAYGNPLSPWQGTTGITSSNALADKAHHSIAFADGADTVSPANPQKVVTNLPGGISAFAPGGTLADGVELITYAFAGDANLDGKVDFSDFIILSNHFGASDINWDHGNFNYDGNVDFSDFIILSNNFGSGTSGNGVGATPRELAQYNAQARSFGISESQIASWDATIANLPEPSCLSALLATGALMARRTKRHANVQPAAAQSPGPLF